MKKICTSAIAMLFVIAAIPAARADWNYITLSSYYVLPNQSITVSGAGFAPGETVTVSVAGQTQTATAGGSGQFTSPSLTIPFSIANSTQGVSAQGNQGHSASASLTVGTFYPVVTPSNWYVTPGGSLNFSGTSFAPNETIAVQEGGAAASSVTTAGDGSFSTGQLMVPYMSPGPLTFNFTGQSSHVSYNVTITVANEQAYINLSNYYGPAGSSVQISGFAFGQSEPVNVTYNGTSLGTATTDSSGRFTLNASVPAGNAGQHTISAAGQKTGKTAQTTFTQSN